ncbi:TatD family deoxyribonuclease [Neobacillus piezotolerans]|uniref:TatD family deoxyribonuclease n=1 Tax=Neobacillus piezotolerans TaxID=2259171 RepID=A0A3D8GU90_9BACI|nr:TatD family hydrolase [Neobacillus piezotolerans]RDU38023.1 TatD family deoxyribonuclease [Neobacillus piezotolerans]
MKAIDAHIHLDKYPKDERERIINSLGENQVEALISVSMDLASCTENLRLFENCPRILPAFGYHPEQQLPSDSELDKLFTWIGGNKEKMAAIGEVGLPYYLRAEDKTGAFSYERYVELLEQFILFANKFNKPVILHAVYDDAPIACGLLEKHNIEKAHFHWFKGDKKTVERMIANGYHVSFTPDVLYEKETREVADQYPLQLMMAETDGPWPFEGRFSGKMTHPAMILDVVKELAFIKGIPVEQASSILHANTKRFYKLKDIF